MNIKIIVRFVVISIVFSCSIIGCGGEKMKIEKSELPSMEKISPLAWEKLSKKMIYFGHQSVGGNILEGVKKILLTHQQIRLNIVQSEDPSVFQRHVFAHSSIGKNGDPISKIDAFKEKINNGIGDKADIAFFKFCFWDIRSQTDIKQVFSHYREVISDLKQKYPKLKFIHVTVPLVAHPKGINARLRRLLHLTVGFDQDNIRRNEFNQMMLEEYGKDLVFDIALIESTLPDGHRTSFTQRGTNYYYLASEFTDDGGHLNEEGRKHGAEHMLITLAKAADSL